MTKDEAYDYFDEHWKDYDAIHNLLDRIFEQHEKEKAPLRSVSAAAVPLPDDSEEVDRLKALLQKCRDQLDEETHRR